MAGFFNKAAGREKNPPSANDTAVNELNFFKKHRLLNYLLSAFAGGTLFAAALPPLNLWFLGFFTLAPLVWCAAQLDWHKAALCGWIWGLGWSLFAFQFLREIEWPVPYLLAPVISIWPAAAAALISAIGRELLFPAAVQIEQYEERKNYLSKRIPWYRVLFFVLTSAVIYTIIEWTRSRLFTWNDLSVTQWRNLPFIQICAVTGSYGVIFLAALSGATLAALKFRRGWITALAVLLLLGANWLYGFQAMKHKDKSDSIWTPALIQGDLSQRRHPGEAQFREALQVYISLSCQAAMLAPDAIIWPESAIPMPLRASHPWAREYASLFSQFIRKYRIPMLIGSLDFSMPKPGESNYGTTNSALYFDSSGELKYKYDKTHRVPYGEYVPFRKYIPEFFTEMVDMGRDLTPGINYDPLHLKNDLRLSTAVCYEGVFGYLTRNFARRGANMLLVISNDAWYPRSSEPEQHLANALMRPIETGIPMLRCGNNGGSGVVRSDGRLVNFLDVPDQPGRIEIKRGRAFGKVEVKYQKNPQMTFYVKYGEWFIWLLIILFLASLTGASVNHFRYSAMLPAAGKK